MGRAARCVCCNPPWHTEISCANCCPKRLPRVLLKPAQWKLSMLASVSADGCCWVALHEMYKCLARDTHQMPVNSTSSSLQWMLKQRMSMRCDQRLCDHVWPCLPLCGAPSTHPPSHPPTHLRPTMLPLLVLVCSIIIDTAATLLCCCPPI